MAKQLNKAQVNHLRRLLGWVRCEYFLTPEQVVQVVRDNAAVIGAPSEDGKARLVEWHKEMSRCPQYVRAALKSLEPLVRDSEGEIVDAETLETMIKHSRKKLLQRTGKLLPKHGHETLK